MRWALLVAAVLVSTTTQAVAAGNQCADEVALRSQSSTTPTAIIFANNIGKPVKLYWIDYRGQRQSYGQVATGSERRQATYMTTPGSSPIWMTTALLSSCRHRRTDVCSSHQTHSNHGAGESHRDAE
jgi:hypothetical protein